MITSRLTTKKTFMLGSLIYLSLAPHAFGSMNQKDDASEKKSFKRSLPVVQNHAGQESPLKVARTQKSSSPQQGSVASRKGTTSLSTKVARFFEEMNKKELGEASTKMTMVRPATPAKIKNSKINDHAVIKFESKDIQEHLEQPSLFYQRASTPKKRTASLRNKAVSFSDQQDLDNSKKKAPLKIYYTMNGAELDEYFLDSDQVTFTSTPDGDDHDTATINFDGCNISITWTQAHSNHDATVDLKFASSGFSGIVSSNLTLASRSFVNNDGIYGHPITEVLTLRANQFLFNETLFLFNKNAFLQAASDSPSVIRELTLTKKAGARSALLKGAIDFSKKDENFEGSGLVISGIQQINITLDKTRF